MTTETTTPAVAKLVKRSLRIASGETAAPRDDESPLSRNRIVGWSIDVPIAATCQPTKVCARDCYAAIGPQLLDQNVARQYRVQRMIEADPVAFARRVVEEYGRRRIEFLRWNGVGDLSPAAVEAINWIVRERPDVRLWVVTRLPEMAARIEHGPNVYVHFSLDQASLARREEFLALGPRTRNYFFSYQCARGELPPAGHGASVVFFRRYEATAGADLAAPETCPLNILDDCEGACARCQRCFSGEAVRMRGAT